MEENYNYYFSLQAGIFIASIGGLIQGLVYQHEYFIVVSGLMLLPTWSIYLEIKKLQSEKPKLYRVFTRLCLASIFCCVVFNNIFVTGIFYLSGSWIYKLNSDCSS